MNHATGNRYIWIHLEQLCEDLPLSMVSAEIYIDNNATTRPLREVVEVVSRFMDQEYGNPSSAHGRGSRCNEFLNRARRQVADALGAEFDNIVFTSGGTEANNTVLYQLLFSPGTPRRLITTQVEHSSILKMAAHLERCGYEVVYLPVDLTGQVSLTDLAAVLEEPTGLVSIQWANNETGVIQPIDELIEISRSHKVLFHTDAAQAVGKVPISVLNTQVDFLTFSGHKFHGLQGTGVLYVRNPSSLRLLFYGGSQESSLRPGTENLPGIVGLATALSVRQDDLASAIGRMRELRDRFESAVLAGVNGAVVNGSVDHRVANTSNVRFSGIDGQALVAQLSNRGIYCSQTSACTSHRPEPSYVLRAMGLSEDEVYSSVRFSFSILNTTDDADHAADAVIEICKRLRQFTVL